MKRFIQFLLATALSIPAVAQTEDSPLILEGGKEYTVTESVAYFKFIPTENEIVKFNGLYLSMDSEPITATSNGSTSSISAAVKYDPRFTAFVAEKGVTYTFSHTIGYGENTPYTISCEVTPISGSVTGSSCDNPMVMTGADYFVFPCTNGKPVYVEYTAPESRRLILNAATTTFTSLKMGESCGNIDDVLSKGDYANGYYPYEILVDEDETLLFEATAARSIYVAIDLQKIIPGATCQDAFTAKEGSNEIPAAAGKYWYSIEVPSSMDNCMLALSSDSKAQVTISTGCKAKGTQYDNLNLRYGPLSSGSVIILEIDKEESDAPVTFNAEFSDLLPIENIQAGEPIEPGETVVTPTASGKYYYSFTSPEENPMLLELTSDGNATISLTQRGSSSPILANGSTFKLKTTPGMTYILSVEPKNGNRCSFEIELNTLLPGALTSYPIDVEYGDTEIPAFSPVYFKYNNPDGGKVALYTDIEGATIGVFEILYNNEYKVNLNNDEKGLWLEAQAGKDYYIRLSKPEDMETKTGILTLTEIPYGEGESWQTAIKVNPGTVTLPEAPAAIWYQIEAPQDGFFTLSLSLEYDYEDIMEVYVGKVSKESVLYLEEGDNWEYAPFKTAVRKGQIIYTHLDYFFGSDAETATFGFEEAKEGEVPSKAFPLTYTDPSCQFTFPDTWDEETFKNTTVWYTIELPAGIFECYSSTSLRVSIYSAENLDTPLATGDWITSGKYGISNVVLSKPGSYYIAVLNSAGEGEATISVRKPEPGETIDTAVMVDTKVLPYSLTIPAHTNKDYWICFDAQQGEISAVTTQSITGSLYSSDDFKNKIADTQSKKENDETLYGLFDYNISEAGTYYLNIRYCTNEATLTFSGSALKDILSGIVSPDYMSSIGVVDGKVILKNLNVGDKVYVYSINGLALRSITSKSDNLEIELPAGVYIIRVNNFAKKITL